MGGAKKKAAEKPSAADVLAQVKKDGAATSAFSANRPLELQIRSLCSKRIKRQSTRRAPWRNVLHRMLRQETDRADRASNVLVEKNNEFNKSFP